MPSSSAAGAPRTVGIYGRRLDLPYQFPDHIPTFLEGLRPRRVVFWLKRSVSALVGYMLEYRVVGKWLDKTEGVAGRTWANVPAQESCS